MGPKPECRPGVEALMASIPTARNAAAEGPGGERAALDRFRRSLAPVWAQRAALTAACAGDADAQAGLQAVDELRYAEENHVRYEAAEVTKRRRQAAEIRQRLSAGH